MPSSEDDRLRGICPNCLKASGGIFPCPSCGFVPEADPAGWNRLRPGTLLQGRYLIGGVLGRGGFGITYRGKDMELELPLAIKEYFPAGLAARESTSRRVSPSGSEDEEDFRQGMDRFLEEAKLLARFENHPTIVSVRDHFRANGTAFMVMPLLEGVTFGRYLQNLGGRIPFSQAVSILMPVMDALHEVHAAGFIHRDVSPDNIFVTTSGQVRLLDFGAAKTAAALAGQRSHSIVLKKGYSPPEQYQSRGNLGPWTDVYGLGATLWRAVTGQVPPDAMDRLEEENLNPPSRLGISIPPEAEKALVRSLSIAPRDRPQSVRELQEFLFAKGGEKESPLPGSAGEGASVPRSQENGEEIPSRGTCSAGRTGRGDGPAGGFPPAEKGRISAESGPAPGASSTFPKKGFRILPLLFALGGAVLMVLFALAWVFSDRPGRDPSPVVAISPSPVEESAERASGTEEEVLQAEPEEPEEISPTASVPEEDPGQVVVRYYHFLENKRYRDAYALLSENRRSGISFGAWVAGYGQTVEQDPEQVDVIESGADRAKVRFLLRATERTDKPDVLRESRYEGVWRLIPVAGRWELDSASVHLLNRKYVSSLVGGEPVAREEPPMDARAFPEETPTPRPQTIIPTETPPSPTPQRSIRPTVVPHTPDETQAGVSPRKSGSSPTPETRGSGSGGEDPLAEGFRLFQSRRYAQAAPLLEEAIGRGSNDIRAYKALAVAYMEQGNYEKAVETARRSVLADPSDGDMKRIAAIAYYRMGEKDRAISAMEKAVHSASGDFRSRKLLTQLLIQAGRYREAMESCKTAISLNPNDPEVHYWKACLHLDDKTMVGAYEEYEILRRLGSPLARKLEKAFPENGGSPSQAQLSEIDRALADFRQASAP